MPRRLMYVQQPKDATLPEIPVPTGELLNRIELSAYVPPKGQRMPVMEEIAAAYVLTTAVGSNRVTPQISDFLRHLRTNDIWSGTRGLRPKSRLASIGSNGSMYPLRTLSGAVPDTCAVLTEGDGQVAMNARQYALHVTAKTSDPNFVAEVMLVQAPEEEHQKEHPVLSRLFRSFATH